MARYDVYAHPDAQLRKTTPYLLDVQNSFLASVGTRIVIPLRLAERVQHPISELNPIFIIKGTDVLLDTAVLAAFPAKLLKTAVTNLSPQAIIITTALDTLFGGH
jgi:toxin CcdB